MASLRAANQCGRPSVGGVVWQAPNVLAITLKRFRQGFFGKVRRSGGQASFFYFIVAVEGVGGRGFFYVMATVRAQINRHIEFPATLSLQQYMAPGSPDPLPVYDLCAAVLHLDLFNIRHAASPFFIFIFSVLLL